MICGVVKYLYKLVCDNVDELLTNAVNCCFSLLSLVTMFKCINLFDNESEWIISLEKLTMESVDKIVRNSVFIEVIIMKKEIHFCLNGLEKSACTHTHTYALLL